MIARLLRFGETRHEDGTPADELLDTVAETHGCARVVAADTLATLERDGEVYAVGEGPEREVFKTWVATNALPADRNRDDTRHVTEQPERQRSQQDGRE